MKKITNWDEFEKLMTQDPEKEVTGVIVYRADNWKEQFSLEARSYKVSNQCKYFKAGMCGSSLYGSSLDGSDQCVRLDWYNWRVEYCYILDAE